jgi:hypothetical protein
MQDGSNLPPAETGTPKNAPESGLRKNIRFACVFAVIFSGYLFVARPATTTASLIFRISLVVVGLGGLLLLLVTKKRAE